MKAMQTIPADESIPLACIPDAISPADQPRYDAARGWLERSIVHREALPDGYALRFPPGAESLSTLADFAALESLCCPFLRFQIEAEPGQRAVWLRLTGREGTREFLKEEFGLP